MMIDFIIRLASWSFVYKNQDNWGTTAEVTILLYFHNVDKGRNQLKKRTSSHQIGWNSFIINNNHWGRDGFDGKDMYSDDYDFHCHSVMRENY